MKRMFDFIIATTAFLALLPLMLLIAIMVGLTSPGGPLFRQVRSGQNGTPFTLLKFRSMSKPRTKDKGEFDPGDASRVTWIGRILRRTKLDELPQLWNVVRGDMSLVGPRPEVPSWTKVYPERWKIVLSVRPGITDPASIAFRNEESILAASDDPETCYREEILPRKLALSEEYVQKRSLAGDFMLVIRTIWVVLGIGTGSGDGNAGQSTT